MSTHFFSLNSSLLPSVSAELAGLSLLSGQVGTVAGEDIIVNMGNRLMSNYNLVQISHRLISQAKAVNKAGFIFSAPDQLFLEFFRTGSGFDCFGLSQDFHVPNKPS